jgi:hypothetical protein
MAEPDDLMHYMQATSELKRERNEAWRRIERAERVIRQIAADWPDHSPICPKSRDPRFNCLCGGDELAAFVADPQ